MEHKSSVNNEETSAELDKGDWRLQTTTHLSQDWLNPWTNVVSPKGSRITVVSVIQLTKKKRLTLPIPNATAAMLSASFKAYASAQKLRLNSEIDKTLKADISFQSEKDALDYIERMIEAIVLAFSAIEAFANEAIPSDFVYSRLNKSKVILEAANKTTIERNISTDEKLTLILPQVLNCQSPKGTNNWQKYKELKDVRDRIIHMKTEDRKSSGPELSTIWKAIILTGTPHLTAKGIIDHYIKSMTNKPQWHARFLDIS